MPSRSLLSVPSSTLALPRVTRSMPFSLWKAPVGTTMLELVTSGRSVTMASLAHCVPATADEMTSAQAAGATPVNSRNDAKGSARI